MSDNKNLSQGLDQIVKEMIGEMVKYSSTLGDWGKYVKLKLKIYLRDNGYDARLSVKPLKTHYKHYKGIYISSYNYITGIYDILFDSDIGELEKNMEKVENIRRIRSIETFAIGIHNKVVDSYLNSLEEHKKKEYNKILVYFEGDVPCYNKINEEIKESIIFGKSISKRDYKLIDQLASMFKVKDKPVYIFTALKEKKKDKNDHEIELSYPDYYKFGFWIFES
jgi:hypothetical protein